VTGHSTWTEVKARAAVAREMGRLLLDPTFRATLARVEFSVGEESRVVVPQAEKHSRVVIATEDDTCGSLVRRLLLDQGEPPLNALSILIGHEGHCTVISVRDITQFEYVKGGSNGESGESSDPARVDGPEG